MDHIDKIINTNLPVLSDIINTNLQIKNKIHNSLNIINYCQIQKLEVYIKNLGLLKVKQLNKIKNKKQNLIYLFQIEELSTEKNLLTIKINDYKNYKIKKKIKEDYLVDKLAKIENKYKRSKHYYSQIIKFHQDDINSYKKQQTDCSKINALDKELKDINIKKNNEINNLIINNKEIINQNLSKIQDYKKKVNLNTLLPIEKENIECNIFILEDENEFLISEEKNEIQNFTNNFKERENEIEAQKNIYLLKNNQKNAKLETEIVKLENIIFEKQQLVEDLRLYCNILKQQYNNFISDKNKQNDIFIKENTLIKEKKTKLSCKQTEIKKKYNSEIEKDSILYNFISKKYNTFIHKNTQQMQNLKKTFIKIQNTDLLTLLLQIIQNNPDIQLLIKKNKLNYYMS